MAGKNRHLYGDIKPILVECPGAVACSAGDLMVLNTGVNNTAYPFDTISGTSGSAEYADYLLKRFIGVSMEDSASGVTENITIATDGVFRFPIYSVTSGVTAGSYVSAVTFAATTKWGNADHVSHETSFSATGSTAVLGVIVKTESGASYVDFRIVPMKSTGVSLA